MATWIIRQAQQSDAEDLAEMRTLLWPDASIEEHRKEVHAFLSGIMAATLPEATLVAQDANGRVIGFLEVDLRSHADGCDPAQPVGYIEGWFVREEFRNQSVGRQLVQAAEDWARQLKCVEMASDVLIDNDRSQQAHAALGYEVVDRCVHYRKTL
ncbi:MAG TPA: GNAT family N-acetyltransferase [Candidatus Angelobacter sp.]|nr:GNAT family N-acetyltransferase [Candidatus Angelobacter sp.]